ncbi:MAG: hypothetical protein K2M01_02555, partial [Paramuribaculum sp.]|nr:hypothetical protein [Paramuribaculum sp.]
MRKVFILIKDLNNDKLSRKEVGIYLRSLIEVAKMIDHEDFEGFIEIEKFNRLIAEIKPSDSDYRNVHELRNHFSEWSDYSELDDKFETVKVGKSDFTNHIYGACAAYSDELVVNHDAYPTNSIHIHIMNGMQLTASKKINMLSCDDVLVYEWFCDNRDPERKFDKYYLKHSRFGPRIVNNKQVSPLTVPEPQLKICLKKAVGGKNERRIYFYDKKQKLLLVFYDENDQNKYHGHEILKKDKKSEEQKIDNDIINKMKKIFKYK